MNSRSVGVLEGVAENGRPAVIVQSRMSRVSAYVALTKPRIIELLLVTTLPTMVVAQRGLPPDLADGGHDGRRIARCGRRQRHQHGRRSRHRRQDAAHQEPAARHRRRHAQRRRWSSRSSWKSGRSRVLWSAVNLLSAVLAVSATAFYVFVYTMWLKRTLGAEHRHRRRRRRRAGARRLGRGAEPARLGAVPALRRDLRLDAAAFLGAGHQIPRRVRVGRRADDAGGGVARVGLASDHALHGGAVGHLARVRARSPTWAPSTSSPRPCWAPCSSGTPSRCSAMALRCAPCGCFTIRLRTSRCCSRPWPSTSSSGDTEGDRGHRVVARNR